MVKNIQNKNLKKRLLEVNYLKITEREYKIKKYLNGFFYKESNFDKRDIISALLAYYFMICFNKLMNEWLFFEEYKKTDIICYKYLFTVQKKLLKENIVFHNNIEIDTTRLLKILIMIYNILPEMLEEVNETHYSDFKDGQKLYKTIYNYIKYYEINFHSIIECSNVNAKSFLRILSLAKNVNKNLDNKNIKKLLNNYYLL